MSIEVFEAPVNSAAINAALAGATTDLAIGRNLTVTGGNIVLGPATSSGVMIRRSGTAAQFRLGDNTNDAALSALSLTLDTSGSLFVGSRGSLSAPADGVFALKNTAGTGFTALTLQSGAGTVIGWYVGTGTPEGAVTARIGSIFSRLDGGAATSIYVKESGTGNTGWVAK